MNPEGTLVPAASLAAIPLVSRPDTASSRSPVPSTRSPVAVAGRPSCFAPLRSDTLCASRHPGHRRRLPVHSAGPACSATSPPKSPNCPLAEGLAGFHWPGADLLQRTEIDFHGVAVATVGNWSRGAGHAQPQRRRPCGEKTVFSSATNDDSACSVIGISLWVPAGSKSAAGNAATACGDVGH